MTVLTLLEVVAAPGQVDLAPRLVRVNCDNDLSEVTTAGFLNDSDLYVSQGPILESDFVFVNYSGGKAIFNAAIDAEGIVTLTAAAQPGSAVVSGATVVSHVPKFTNTTGGIQDSGVLITDLQLHANIKAFSYSFAGGSTTATVPLTGITTSSIATASIATAANAAVVNVVKILANGNITIVFSADPGVSTLNVIAFIAPQ